MSDDVDLEELKRQTSTGDRLDEAAAEESRASLRADILEELEAIDRGERQKTVSAWDGNMAALLSALEREENAADRERLAESLATALETDTPADADRSDILRLAVRVGLNEAAPEYLETVREALAEQASQDV